MRDLHPLEEKNVTTRSDNSTTNRSNDHEIKDHECYEEEVDDDREIPTFVQALHELCTPPKAKTRDPHVIRTAAVAAALVETIQDKMGIDHHHHHHTPNRKGTSHGNDSLEQVHPAAFFLAALSAFSATTTVSSSPSQNQTTVDESDTLTSLQQGPQRQILEVMRIAIPYVAKSNPNLYVAQFSLLSKSLRATVLSIPILSSDLLFPKNHANKTETSKLNASEEQLSLVGGWNALLRQIIRTSSVAICSLIQAEGAALKNLEKDLFTCYHSTVLQHFEDARPKVRKEAHVASLDILRFCCVHDSNRSQNHSSSTTSSPSTPSCLIPQHMVQYIHRILVAALDSNNLQTHDQFVKVLHLLSFVDRAFLYLPYEGRILLWEDLVQLIVVMSTTATTSALENPMNLKPQQHPLQNTRVMICHEAFTILIHSLDGGVEELEEDKYFLQQRKEEEQKKWKQHAAKALASFIQCQSSILTFANLSFDHSMGGECLILYSRCIATLTEYLLRLSPNDMKGNKNSSNMDANKTKEMEIVAIKLLPVCISSVLNCFADDNHDKNMDASIVQGICVELGRILRAVKSIYETEWSISAGEKDKCVAGCLSSLEQILQSKYRMHWNISLSSLATFVVLNIHGMIPTDSDVKVGTIGEMTKLFQPIVTTLVRLHATVGEAKLKVAIEHTVRDIITGIGMELFTCLVSLSDDDYIGTDDKKMKKANRNTKRIDGLISDDRAWILSILKSSISTLQMSCKYRPRLAYFQGHVLALARKCDTASVTEGITTVEAATHRSRVIDLWSLFPAFCSSPIDIDATFPTLASSLVRAMGDVRYPELVTIICSGLTLLAENVKKMKEDINDDQTGKDAMILSDASKGLLPAMFKLVETLHESTLAKADVKNSSSSHKMDVDEESDEDKEEDLGKRSQNMQRATIVTTAISAFAVISPRSLVQSLFKKLLQRLLVATQSQDDETERLCTLLGLSQALVASQVLDEDNISLIYRAVRPLIRSDEYNNRVQKRAYKVMAEICEQYNSFVTTPERLSEMTELFVSSVMTLHVSARQMRLKCMTFVIDGLNRNNSKHMAVISSIMGDVLLCLKDANAKTREAAYKMLMAMAKVHNDLSEYIQIIVAALAAQTPHMRSAAVMALSRLVFELARVDSVVQSLLPSLLQTVVVLFDENSREVVKSVIGFVRVSIAALEKEQLEPLLPDVVGGLTKFNRGKGRFRSKIKIILKKLVKYYGYEKITPLVPKDDTRLITHIRKLAERAARKKLAMIQNSSNPHDRQAFDDLMNSDEDDSDHGQTLVTGLTGYTRATAKSGMKTTVTGATKLTDKAKSVRSVAQSTRSVKTSVVPGPRIDLRKERNGEVIDLMDPEMSKGVRFMDEGSESEFSDEEVLTFDDHGRLVITDDVVEEKDEDSHMGDESMMQGNKKQRLSKFESAKISRDEAMAKRTLKQTQERRPVKDLGSAYKSKKAGGDVKKKGQKYEPYAYVPLDGRRYTKKNRQNAIAEMATVVRSKTGGKRKK